MVFGLFGGNKEPQSPSEMGYNPSEEFQEFMRYSAPIFRDDKEEGFSDTLFGAVNQGSLDPKTALAMVQSRTSPTSSYFKSKEFEDLLNYQLGGERARGIIGDAFATNYFRPGEQREIEGYYQAAERAGVTNNPNELRNFMTQRLARSPEGESKRPFDQAQYQMAAYYGAPLRDTQGNNTGQYAVFGRSKDSVGRVAGARESLSESDKFVKDRLAKMGSR